MRLFFVSLFPCIIGLFSTFFWFAFFGGAYVESSGIDTSKFLCKMYDVYQWLDKLDKLGVALFFVAFFGTIYVGYSGLLYLGNFSWIIGEPEECEITFNIVEVYRDKLYVDVGSESKYSAAQIMMGFWNFVLLPILAYLFITFFGWLVFIIQKIRGDC